MTHARALLVTAALIAVLNGCDSGDEPDAGVTFDADVSLDAGPDPLDASMRDAATADASPDAGRGTGMPIEERGAVLRDRVDRLTTSIGATPMGERVDGPFFASSTAAAGIVALIGEDGLQTLTLTDGAVRAHADLRHTNIVADSVEDAIDDLVAEGAASVVAVRADLEALFLALEDYALGLIDVYFSRLDDGLLLTPVVRESFAYEQSFLRTSEFADMTFVVEGTSVSDPTATVDVECTIGSPVSLMVRVVDELDNEIIATQSGTDRVTFSIPAEFEFPMPIAVVVDAGTAFGDPWEPCRATVTSRRQLRIEPRTISDIDMVFDVAFEAYELDLADAEGAIADLDLAGFDPDVLAGVESTISQLTDLLAPLSAAAADPAVEVPVEAFERMNRQLFYIGPMFDAQVASIELAGAPASSLRAALTALRADGPAVVAAAAD